MRRFYFQLNDGFDELLDDLEGVVLVGGIAEDAGTKCDQLPGRKVTQCSE